MIKRILSIMLGLTLAVNSFCFADQFPGSVSANAIAVKNEVVNVGLGVPNYDYLKASNPPENWKSTGLYAPPGKEIIFEVPRGALGLQAQIGAHTDDLSEIPEKERLRQPKIVITKPLNEGINKIKSPFGGNIYLIPTEDQQGKTANVKISNAVKSPYFVLGKTTDAQWNTTIKNYPAPFAELEGNRVILTVPTRYIKNVKNPTEIMNMWDAFVNKMDGLAGITPLKAKHRFVADIQISCGYLHSGYPIMLYDDPTIKSMLDVKLFKTDGWGFWHELGHNYQQNNWYLDSLIEVSNNIYSLYMSESYGNKNRLLEDNDGTGASSFQDAIKYVNRTDSNKDFEDDNQTTYFTRLVMFWQLKQAYGWNFFTRLFTAFRQYPVEKDPQDKQAMMDLLVVLSSKNSNNNLLEFFDKWGFKYSSRAKATVENMKLQKPKDKIWLLQMK